MPLYQDTDVRKILYISSVALQLSGGDGSQSTRFVRDIAAYLSASCSEFFHVKVVPPAWIHIELTDPTLAAWLNFLIDEKRHLKECEQINQFTNIRVGELHPQDCGLKNIDLCFQVQYTHARCCSLLKLASRDGLIKIVQDGANILELSPTQSIPWLDCDQKLRFYRPEELRLLALLVKTVDNLVFPDSKSVVNWNTAALRLSAAFESFWCECRIWGEVKINSLELAQARLGLLMATQWVLQSVLEGKLGIVAPWEL
ncbi:DALR anticodon-binding domain-containing protein [Okeanomitos corallinicola TIOX110]|uniref:DALR anticodon-binding domain-containing protein n=1 Tax=Okeanomitos corallinicola TIOX110 TaxID=3133117 RepID=A0ABZ2UWF9_9CYAN